MADEYFTVKRWEVLNRIIFQRRAGSRAKCWGMKGEHRCVCTDVPSQLSPDVEHEERKWAVPERLRSARGCGAARALCTAARAAPWPAEVARRPGLYWDLHHHHHHHHHLLHQPLAVAAARALRRCDPRNSRALVALVARGRRNDARAHLHLPRAARLPGVGLGPDRPDSGETRTLIPDPDLSAAHTRLLICDQLIG